MLKVEASDLFVIIAAGIQYICKISRLLQLLKDAGRTSRFQRLCCNWWIAHQCLSWYRAGTKLPKYPDKLLQITIRIRIDFGFKTFYCWSNSCYWFPVVREVFSSFHFGNVTLRLSFCFFFFPSVMNSLGNNLKDSLLCLRICLKLLCCFFTDYWAWITNWKLISLTVGSITTIPTLPPSCTPTAFCLRIRISVVRMTTIFPLILAASRVLSLQKQGVLPYVLYPWKGEPYPQTSSLHLLRISFKQVFLQL